MTDQHPQDQPEGEPTDAGFEQELDAVLAKASSLAEGLSAEVGSSDAPPVATVATSPHTDDNAPVANLDEELSTLEGLLAKTETELHESAAGGSAVDGEDDTPGASGEAPPTTGEAAAPDDQVPDFMAEFTGGQDPAADPSGELDPATSAALPSLEMEEPTGGASTAASSKPGVVGTGMLGVVGTPQPAKVEEDPPGAAASHSGVAENPEEQAAAPARGATAASRSAVADVRRALADRLSPVTYTVAECTVRMLETADRPFRKLGETPRRWLGWLALATMGTSVVVFVLSFLIG